MPAGPNPRTALVIGSRGVLGVAISRALQADGWTIIGGSRGGGEAGGKLVDLDRPETVAPAMAGADVVIDAVAHPEMTPERAVLRDGGALIDVSARPAAAGQALRRETQTALGTVVINCGRTPGVSSLVVAELLEAHPEADEVQVAFSFSASGASGKAGGRFVHGHLTSVGRHGTATIPFAPPMGGGRCLGFAEPERAWLGDLPGERVVSTYARFSPSFLNGMLLFTNTFGMMKVLPAGAFAPKRTEAPDEFTNEPVCDWVAVLRNGEPLAARVVTGTGNYRTTAAATAVLAGAVADLAGSGSLKTGCFEPQELFTLGGLQSQLSEHGLTVTAVP